MVSKTAKSVEPETDDEGYLPPAAWNPGCSEASFDGPFIQKGRVNLAVNKSRSLTAHAPDGGRD